MTILRRAGKRAKLLVLVVAAGIALAACSVVNTTSSEVALQYGGGPFDSVSYVSCTGPSVHDTHDVNDTHYYYPIGQRDYTFNSVSGSDSPPLTAVSKDGQQLTVIGTVKFTLNTDCSNWPKSAKDNTTGQDWPGGRIQAFHERVDSNFHAAPTDGGTEMNQPAWNNLLSAYLGAAIDRAAALEALKYNWDQLYSDSATVTAWSSAVQGAIPDILDKLTLGTTMFHIDTVLLQKPGIQPQLQSGLTDKQAAVLRQQSAAIDQQAATSFPGGIAGYEQYQYQQALNKAIANGQVKVIPVPQGSPVIVNPVG